VKVWVSVLPGVDWFRLLGALLGSLTPVGAFLLGREIFDRRFGWILGLAAVVSVQLIFYSQYVRMFNIHALLPCLSILWFIRALKTNEWRYWLLTGLANLVGFYVYILMFTLFAAEFIVLVVHFKSDLKRYIRPLVGSIPYFLAVLIWILPAIKRYGQLEGQFWVQPLSWSNYFEVFFSFGIGRIFRGTPYLAGLVSLPFIVGFILGLRLGIKNTQLRNIILIFLFIIVIFALLSLMGQSFMFSRYLMFILPLYLLVSIAGWLGIRRELWRRLGLVLLTFSMASVLIFYYIDYYRMHEYYGYLRTGSQAEAGEGHHLSMIAEDVANLICDDEVIIHFSSPYLRVCSYFGMLVYHERKFSEHIYSKDPIAQHNGRQYLKPGEWIRSLDDLTSQPSGIWVVTLDNPNAFFDEDVLSGAKRPHWIHKENLMVELREAGYTYTEMLTRGKVVAIYFIREADDNTAEEPGV
jgi:4-amino-4-deoxy-L-arabinose transferase-like glycosyltransferase